MAVIHGRNPVAEALQQGAALDKIYLLKGGKGAVLEEIKKMARQQRVPVVEADRRKLNQVAGNVKHQGVVALAPPVPYVGLENLVEKIQNSGGPAALVLLDKIQDPHNLGAIIRSAEIFGFHGLIFSLQDGVPLTDTAVKASAGAVFHLDLCKVENTSRAVKYLADSGLWVYASSSHAEKKVSDIDFRQSFVLIIGSEGKGVRPGLLKHCDETFAIPQLGKTESLNASVAAGVIMYEAMSQRLA
ncbi:MAG: 23S rRNA (guanosine(2251)-2'-O)-methyltransferase RlmB [Calditrichia bacterium]